MIYTSLKQCIDDLERSGHLIRVREEVDPHLEMAAIHRRVYAEKGPALLYERVKGSSFPAVSNLFGTVERSRFIFRSTIGNVKRLIRMKADPAAALKKPLGSLTSSFSAIRALPQKVSSAPLLSYRTVLSALPQIQAWPEDGGAFITLPQVLSEDPLKPGILNSNLGMYRIQISGNDYLPESEAGMHYQLHRGIGIHHTRAIENRLPLRVSIFVGGPPAHTFAAVMPLPEGIPEVSFAGVLAGRRFRYADWNGWRLSADADFCIVGVIVPDCVKPEGPFGDHLGYYSLKHDFPVLKVEAVFHRKNAVWPFTVVGRPPQEDTTFNLLIQEITGPMIPTEIPGLKEVNAVDQAGVHPLLLAIGRERYVPYEQREPREILTVANAVLGFGQLSLAKYLFITAEEDDPRLSTHDPEAFFRHILERVDWKRDLHFQTRTTIDTLDYTGHSITRGSKVVIAAAGRKRRGLKVGLPADFSLSDGFGKAGNIMPGVVAIEGPKFSTYARAEKEMRDFAAAWKPEKSDEKTALVIITDDAGFTAASIDNFLWITFTRSDPAQDIYGIGSFIENKHWGCTGPLIIDARVKPHHAPLLEEDPEILKRVEALGSQGHSLHGYI